MREIKRNTQIQIYILWENLGEKGGGLFWAGVGLALGHIALGHAGGRLHSPLKRLILTPFCKYIIINNDNNCCFFLI